MNRSMKRKIAKARRNALLVAALMLVVCIASIGGTIAWLTDSTGEVQNTFTPSDIDIELEETVPEDYTAKMVPGVEIPKDPKVTVEVGSEPCWVFVKIVESSNFDEYFENYTVAAPWKALAGVDGVYYIQQNADAGATTVTVEKEYPIPAAFEKYAKCVNVILGQEKYE